MSGFCYSIFLFIHSVSPGVKDIPYLPAKCLRNRGQLSPVELVTGSHSSVLNCTRLYTMANGGNFENTTSFPLFSYILSTAGHYVIIFVLHFWKINSLD